MAVNFENIKIGRMYTRPELAQIWGYASHQALARGVVTPRGDNKIILFVTEEKQSFQEQYCDRLDDNTLHWEGPTDHFAEERMIHASKTKDEIHVFHRKRHHAPFTYLGCATVERATRNATKPSRFELLLDERRVGTHPLIKEAPKPAILSALEESPSQPKALALSDGPPIPLDDKIETVLKSQKRALHYREIQQRVLQKYGTRHSVNGALNSSPNIRRLLPGVFVHKSTYDSEFGERFEIEKAAILDLAREEIEESTEPVPIEALTQILHDSGKLHTLSKMVISNVIASIAQTEKDVLIIPTPGNPRTRSLIHRHMPEKAPADTSCDKVSVSDQNEKALMPAEKPLVASDRGTPHEGDFVIYLEKLLKMDRPQDHIRMQTWDSWRTHLKGKAISHGRVSDISRQLNLEWPYTRKEETLSDYLGLDLNQLTELSGFGPKKLRTIILCIAHCFFLESVSPKNKFYISERTEIEIQPHDFHMNALSTKIENEAMKPVLKPEIGYGEAKHISSQKGKTERYELTELVLNAKLSVRAENVIFRNISSIKELADLTYPKLLAFRNCGRKTAVEIMALVRKIGATAAASTTRGEVPLLDNISQSQPKTLIFEEKTKNALASPPTMEGLNALPFFIGKRLAFLSQDELHPGYRATLKLSDVPMSVRTAKVLNQIGYDRLAQVLLTPRFELLRQKNFGLKSLEELHAIVTNLILPEKADAKDHEIDYSSFSGMIRTWLDSCRFRPRDQEIIVMWLSSIENNRVTFQDIADKYSLSRERIRQIIDKAFRRFRHPAHSKKLIPFWNKIDEIVDSGGGVIGLPQLAQTIGKELQWDSPPGPTSLKRLVTQCGLTHLYIDKAAETITLEDCNCLACNVPVESLSKIFGEPNSGRMNIWVVCKKLADICENDCVHRSTPVTAFHRAFLEMAIYKAADICVLQDDLVFPKYDWDIQYGPNLSSVAYTLLQEHGSPLHFTELATIVREKSERFKDVSDAYVHGALLNEENIQIFERGTYGLRDWDLEKYKTVSEAIEETLDEKDLPMHSTEIVGALSGRYSKENILAALSRKTRFVHLGEGFYSRSEWWQTQTCERLIDNLEKPLGSFMRYLTQNIKCSYKLVLGLLFLRKMDLQGKAPLNSLRDSFFHFYLDRKMKKLAIEAESTAVNNIDESDDSLALYSYIKNPLQSFLNSGYFLKNDSMLSLHEDIALHLSGKKTIQICMIILIKRIEEYYSLLVSEKNRDSEAYISGLIFSEPSPGSTAESAGAGFESNQNSPETITIRSEHRTKIKL